MFLFKHTRTHTRIPFLSLCGITLLLPSLPFSTLSLVAHVYARGALPHTHTDVGGHSTRTSLLWHVLRDPRVISRHKAAAVAAAVAAGGTLRMKPNRGTPSTISALPLGPFSSSHIHKGNSVSRAREARVGGGPLAHRLKRNWF